MTIYVDVLLFVNLVINGLMLYSVILISGAETSVLRFFIADGIASLYDFIICLPPLTFMLSVTAKICVGALICACAFRHHGVIEYFKHLCLLFSISFMYTSGVMAAAICIGNKYIYIKNNEIYFNLSVTFILCIIIGLSALLGIVKLIYNRKLNRTDIYDCTITVKDKSENLICFSDTGNMLKDIITGVPVIIIDRNTAIKLLPDFAKENPDEMSVETKSRFRMIPCKAPGIGKGILPAFRPDSFIANGIFSKVIIAVSDFKFDSENRYNGILNGDLFRNGAKLNESVQKCRKRLY